MGQDAREAPFFFMKPASAAVDASSETSIPYPPLTSNFHHEVELVVALAEGGADVPQDRAERLVFGYAIGLDMTRRDLQLAARDKGRPWEFGKSFSQSAPIGTITPAARVGHPTSGQITLSVNGVTRQSSNLDQMIWTVAESIAFLSRYEAVRPGDLIMTGTPEGVGPVKPGDALHGRIELLDDIRVRIAE
jgi:fumarylpyruvate hydrolase